MKQGAEMAISYHCNIGNCPVCGNAIESYHVIPCTSVYVFAPCGCKSQTWTVVDGKFVGKSSQDIPPTIGENRRESLGKRVRQVWVAWAKTQPNPKPEWLVPWEELEERYKEVDRRIGSALWGDFVNEFSEAMANAAIAAIDEVHGGKKQN